MSDPGGSSRGPKAAGADLSPTDRAAILAQLRSAQSALQSGPREEDPRQTHARAIAQERAEALSAAAERDGSPAAPTVPRSSRLDAFASADPDSSAPASSDGSRSRQQRRAGERQQTKRGRTKASSSSERSKAKPSAHARSVSVRRRVQRITKRRQQTRDALIADVESKGGTGYSPAEIPGKVRPIHRQIERDETGARARAALASWPRRLNGFKRLVLEAAGGFDLENERPDTHIRFRRIVAFAHSIVMLSRGTKRQGFARVAAGFSRGALAQLSINLDTGEPCTVSYVFATSHAGDRYAIDDCGPMTALRRSGALLFDQPPAWASDPRFLGIPKPRRVDGELVMVRNALNLYWISARPRPPTTPLA